MTVDEANKTKRGTRWVVPTTAVVIGAGYLIAGIAGDQVWFGVFGLVLMLVAAAAFVMAGRFSETVAGLADRSDERINQIEQRAAAAAGVVVLVAVIVMFMVSIALGQDGSPYYQLGALGGVTYMLALGYCASADSR